MELRIPDHIRTDGGTQSRFKIDQPTVDDYADAMKAGDQFPPLDVYYDGEVYWLADGFHRLHAALQIGRETITVDVKQGTLRDAILHSVGVNATHGLRRTNDDKRRAVICLLRDPEWSQWSDREIARRCRVSNRFVSNLRKYVVPDPYNPTVNGTQIEKKVIRGGTEYTMNTANIGQKNQPAPSSIDADLDKRLVNALHSMQGATERWAERKKTGLNNDDLQKAISYEFGIRGGSSGPGITSISYKGGKKPAFWYDAVTSGDKKPTLSGMKLVDKVRELLSIPEPVLYRCRWWKCNGDNTKENGFTVPSNTMTCRKCGAKHAEGFSGIALVPGEKERLEELNRQAPAPLEVWQLERYVTDWLNQLNSVKADPVNEPLRILTAIKEKERGNLPTPLWQAHLGDIESYLKHTLKLTNYNKRDLIQACHNLLEQRRQQQIATAKSEAVTITPEREDETNPGNIVAQGDDGNKYSVAEELPAGVTPVVMRGHWYCGRCDQKYGPGTRYWVKGYTKPVCQPCLEEVSAGKVRYTIFECPHCNQNMIHRLGSGSPSHTCHNCGQTWETPSQFFTAYNEALALARGNNGHTTTTEQNQQQPAAGTILGIELSLDELKHLQYVCRNNMNLNEKRGNPGLVKLFTQLYDQTEHTIQATQEKERLAV